MYKLIKTNQQPWEGGMTQEEMKEIIIDTINTQKRKDFRTQHEGSIFKKSKALIKFEKQLEEFETAVSDGLWTPSWMPTTR